MQPARNPDVTTADDELARTAARLEDSSAEDILRFAFEAYGPRIAISTAFGAEGCALVAMAAAIRPGVRVFTIDTGYLFDESRELADRLRRRYDIDLVIAEPARTVAEQDAALGPRLYERDPDACCAARKVEPTRRALSGLDAWIAGLRRDQGPSRAGIRILEHHELDGRLLVKVHPLARWTRTDTWRYVLDHDVPYNPLLDQGYRSIGCAPCTRPVGDDDPERAGRWDGRKQECGIHTFTIRTK
jgi:phosphoadenosine phosphosulfate reductase